MNTRQLALTLQIACHKSHLWIRYLLRHRLKDVLFPSFYMAKQDGRPACDSKVIADSSAETTLILIYNPEILGVPSDVRLPEGCFITTDRQRMDEATAVVFYLPHIERLSHLTKRHGQLWIAWTMECELHYPPWENPNIRRQFDLRVSYHQDADVMTSSLPADYATSFRASPQPKTPDNIVAYFASNYGERSGRTRYVAELMKYLNVHSYGKCLRNRRLSPEVDNDKGKCATLARYKFNLAFENAIAPDYVTEKFFHPLSVGCVPVYLGAPNIDDYAPGEHCYINAADFSTPRDLAAYLLQLNADDEAYQSYLTWRHQPFRPQFLDIVKRQAGNPFIRVYRKIQELRGLRT